MPLLDVRDVGVRFGGIVALDGVSFSVEPGTIVGLIGPNGAGKTTLFNCLSRLYDCDRGEITFDGVPLRPLPRHRVAGLGIGRTFQNVALFDRLTVRDNILVGGHARTSGDFVSDALKLPWATRTDVGLRREAERLIAELELEDVADKGVAGLPFGTRKRVELARALAAQPRLLLLD